MQYLQPYVYQVIREIIEKRKTDRKFPYVAIRNEVQSQIISDIRATISELEADGLLAHGENINGIELYRKGDNPDNSHLKTCK